MIEDGVDGVVVEPEDVDSVADAVVALLRDPSRLREMGRRGNEKAGRRLARYVWLTRCFERSVADTADRANGNWLRYWM